MESLPPVRTRAGPVDGVASASVLALALVLAPQAVGPVRALLLTLQKRKGDFIQKLECHSAKRNTFILYKRKGHTHIPGDLWGIRVK